MGWLDTIRQALSPAPDLSGSVPDTSHIGTLVDIKSGQRGDQAAITRGMPTAINKRLAYTVHQSPFVAGEQFGGDESPVVRLMRRQRGQGGMYQFNRLPHGTAHQLWLLTLHVMREGVPALDAAIVKRRFLEGELVAVSEDQSLAEDLNEWLRTVPVGYTPQQPKRGVQVALDNLGENADEFGEAVYDIRLTADRKDVERIVVPDSRHFSYMRQEGNDEDYWLHMKNSITGIDELIRSPNINSFQFSPNPHSPWGRALASGLEFTSEIFVRLMVSLNNLVWKMGDPSKIWKLLYDVESQVSSSDQDEDLEVLKNIIDQGYRARNRGEAIDLYYSAQGANLDSEALGENLIISSLAPYFKDMLTLMTAQVIGKADVPAWLYPAGIVPAEGLNSDRAQMEGNIAQVAANQRAIRLNRPAMHMINTWLIATGNSRWVGSFTLEREAISPVNEKMRQEARKTQAEADAIHVDTVGVLEAMGVVTDPPAYLEQREVI